MSIKRGSPSWDGKNAASHLLPFFIGFMAYVLMIGSAMAWKPRTHILTVNEALYDAHDGQICMPQVSGYSTVRDEWQSLPISSTPLHEWVFIPPGEPNGGNWVVINNLIPMAKYVRAGAVGPDGVPDPVYGQLLTHVDHTQTVVNSESLAQELFDNLPEVVADFAGRIEEDIALISTTLTAQPTWRSIEWAHQVTERALHFNDLYLGQLTAYDRYLASENRLETLTFRQLLQTSLLSMAFERLTCSSCRGNERPEATNRACIQILRSCDAQPRPLGLKAIIAGQVTGVPPQALEDWDIRLDTGTINLIRGRYAEYLMANAFALGYLMHFTGDSFAHSWVNEIVKTPFDPAAGRRQPRFDCPNSVEGCFGEQIAAIEEIQHMNVEAYVDARYQPELGGQACVGRTSAALVENVSICDHIDGEEGLPLPIECDYCNPLDWPGHEHDGQRDISHLCDDCYQVCDPWREICPIAIAPSDACGKECILLDQELEVCRQGPADQIRACEIEAHNACADSTMECMCDEGVATLAVVTPGDPSENPEYTCLNEENMPSVRYAWFMRDRAARYSDLAELERDIATTNREGAALARQGALYPNGQRISEEDEDGDGVPENEEVALQLLADADAREAAAEQYDRYAEGECNRFELSASVQAPGPLEGIEVPRLPPVQMIFLERDEQGNPVLNDEGQPTAGPRPCQIDRDCIEVRGEERIQRGQCIDLSAHGREGRWCAQPTQEEPPAPPMGVPEPGEEPKLNECVYINCLFSPGVTERCPYNAIHRREGFNPLSVNGKLECDQTSTVELQNNAIAAEEFLNKSSPDDIELPKSFYREVFQGRHFGDGVGRRDLFWSTQPLGTWSMGGQLTNGLWGIYDAARVAALASQSLTDPLGYLIHHADDWEEAGHVAAFYVALQVFSYSGSAFFNAVGNATISIPFVGYFLAIPAYYASMVLGLAPAILEIMGTGVSESLHAYAARIKHRLRVNMTDGVATAVKSIGSGTRRAYATAELLSVFNELYQNLPDAVDCSELPLSQVLEGEAGFAEWGSVISGVFMVSAFELAGCQVFRALFRRYLVDYVYEEIGKVARAAMQKHGCATLGFWSGDNIELQDCARAVKGATADDIRESVQQMEDFLRAIDNDEDEETIRTRYEAWYKATTGRTVSLVGEEALTDNVSSAQADFRKVEYAFGSRGVEVTASIDRQLDPGLPGGVRAYLAADPQRRLPPLSLTHFGPLYNSVQLSKLVMLGPGITCREVMGQLCEHHPDYPCCASLEDPSIGVVPNGCLNTRRELICAESKEDPWADISRAYLVAAQNGGIRGLVTVANVAKQVVDPEIQTPPNDYFFLTPVAAAEGLDLDMDGRQDGALNVRALYSVDPIDTEEATYLQSFFLEQFVTDEHDLCARVGHNIMCNAISSLDDPDDYCREIGAWIDENNLSVLARQTLEGGLQERDQRLASALQAIRDYEPGGKSCDLLSMVDTVVDRMNEILDLDEPIPHYQPLGYRQRDFVLLAGDDAEGIGVSDLRRQIYNEGIAPADFGHPINHRSVILDRVSKELKHAERDLERPGDLYGYLQHGLTRFSLANKDTHVSRIYQRIFHPYYCPADPVISDEDSIFVSQADDDCDGIPNGCDNCAVHFNPGQLDTNQDGTGDHCEAGDPPGDLRCGLDRIAPDVPDVRPDNTTAGGCHCSSTESSGSGFIGMTLLLLSGLFGRRRRNTDKG